MLMGASHPAKLSVKQGNGDNLYISIHRPQCQVSGFVLSAHKHQAEHSPPGTGAQQLLAKGHQSLSLPCLYRSAICTTEHLTHEDFHVFSLINLSSDIFEVILSIISLCQNSL